MKPILYSSIFPSFLTSLMLVPSSCSRHSFCRNINLSKHCTYSYYAMCGSSCLHFYTRTYTAQMLVHMPVVCSIVLGLIFSFSRVFHNIRSVYLTSFVYNVVSSTTFLASHEMSVYARVAQNSA